MTITSLDFWHIKTKLWNVGMSTQVCMWEKRNGGEEYHFLEKLDVKKPLLSPLQTSQSSEYLTHR